jgi:predicted nuclease with TOPRIM domain
LLVQDLKEENDSLKRGSYLSDQDRYQFREKLKRLEEESSSSRSVKSPVSPMRKESNTSHTTDSMSYFERKEQLEQQLRQLAEEKSKLTFELSRIPKTGAKSRQRFAEIEANLDQVDHNMATTRKMMKDLGFL